MAEGNVQLEALADTLKVSVEKVTSVEGVKTFLNGNKIVLTVAVEGVKTRLVIPTPKKPKVERLEPEYIEKIKVARKVFKGKRDALYLFTLLVSLHSELKKFNFKVDAESKEILGPALNTLKKDLSEVKELEVL